MFLRCHSWFSFRYGVMSVDALLAEAHSRGIRRLALTDINNTSGCLDFIRLARSKYGIEPVVGIDFRNPGNRQCYTGLALNNQGFFLLNRFLSAHLASAEPFPAEAPELESVAFIYPFEQAPANIKPMVFRGVSPRSLLVYLRAGKHHANDLALHTVSFRNRKDFNTHRLLRAVAGNKLLSRLPQAEQGTEHDLFLQTEELSRLYESAPFLLKAADGLLEQCSISMQFGANKNKKHFTDSAASDMERLRSLSEAGIPERYGSANLLIRERIATELEMIGRLGFASYFLINHDIVSYARHKQFFYVGRGSGANSIVAYLLRITDVDPIDLDLYFERFINEHRVNPPDFDIDFSWRDRDAVIRYIFNRYGTDYTALLATYSTFQEHAIYRELGKVFGLPAAEIDLLPQTIKNGSLDHIAHLISVYGARLLNFPSHLGIHAGGVLISEVPIHNYTATSFPPKGFPVTQFSMLEAEDLGLHKFDILSQRGLGHIRDSVELIKQNRGVDIDIHALAAFKKDPAIKTLLRTGHTMGCFYVESPAMRMLLKKLGAEEYRDLVAASSIIRPGVASSGMMREYILRFRYPERRTYIHPKLQELTAETFGIMVYQEDVIRVAHFFAGMSLSDADLLRRGMSGKFRARDEFRKAKETFVQGCRKQGYTEEVTLEVWRQMESFASYSFSKGHSASYAVESYQSLYLKAHFPIEFMVGVINNFGGFYQTEYYVHEARMAGANILPPCVNHSEELTIVNGKDVYLGFGLMAELEHKTAERIVIERRRNGSFQHLADFMTRVEISLEQLRLLIRVGAFRFTTYRKKELLWDLLRLIGYQKHTQCQPELFARKKMNFELPPLEQHALEDASDEIAILGFPLCSPFRLIEIPDYCSKLKADDLCSFTNQYVSISGYYVCRKYSRTIRGEQMYFGTFIDQDGHFFDTVHFPLPAQQSPFRGKGCYMIYGKVRVEFDYPCIEVSRMEKLAMKEILRS